MPKTVTEAQIMIVDHVVRKYDNFLSRYSGSEIAQHIKKTPTIYLGDADADIKTGYASLLITLRDLIDVEINDLED